MNLRMKKYSIMEAEDYEAIVKKFKRHFPAFKITSVKEIKHEKED